MVWPALSLAVWLSRTSAPCRLSSLSASAPGPALPYRACEAWARALGDRVADARQTAWVSSSIPPGTGGLREEGSKEHGGPVSWGWVRTARHWEQRWKEGRAGGRHAVFISGVQESSRLEELLWSCGAPHQDETSSSPTNLVKASRQGAQPPRPDQCIPHGCHWDALAKHDLEVNDKRTWKRAS